MEKEDISKALVNQLEKFVSSIFEEIPTISNNTYFCELGASSCDQAVIVADTLNALSINIPVEKALVANSVGELIDLIDECVKTQREKEGIFLLPNENQSRLNESICSI